MSRKIVMLGTVHQTQRSQSAVFIPVPQESTSKAVTVYSYSKADFIYDLRASSSGKDDGPSKIKLKDMLMAKWEEAKTEKVINYDLNCMYKFVPGDFNFSIQLNVERGQLRRKPMRFHNVREPFNNLRWNFTKLKPEEVMIYLRCKDRFNSSDPLDRHMIAVNSAPLERGHSLLLPSINRCVPQVLTEPAIRLATDLMLLVEDESFHVLYNSLLGMASVNHLHLHLLTYPYDSDLINRICEHIYDNVYVIRRPIWFVHVIILQLTSADNYEKFVTSISRIVDYISSKETAHNLFFTRAQPLRTTGALHSEDRAAKLPKLVTVYIFPRVSVVGAKPAVNFNPAALELAGCLTAYSWRFFETVTEEAALRVMDEEATLPDSQFNQICSDLADIVSGKRTPNEHADLDDESELSSPELEELRDSFQTFEMHSPRRFYTNKTCAFNFTKKKSKSVD